MKGVDAMVSAKKPDPKDRTLRERGALNPHPQCVTDELFAEYEFFDSRDLVQVKYEMLRRAQKEGWSVTRSAKAFGLSRVAYYRALAAFRKTGIWGLMPRRRGPRHPHKLSPEVMDFVREALKKEPSLSTANLPRMIKKRFGISIHRRSIERALRRIEKRG
jgi:transposase